MIVKGNEEIKVKKKEPENLNDLMMMDEEEQTKRVYNRKEKRKIMNQKVQCNFCKKHIKRKNSLYHNHDNYFLCRPCYDEIAKEHNTESNLR